jgi:ATP-dependent Clp protease ATP-binding subunit ClpB
MQLEIERTALKKESDKASKERLDDLRQELANLRDKSKSMRAQWDTEKAALQEVRKLREELEQRRLELERAERDYDLGKSAELKHGVIPSLEAKLKEKETALASEGNRLLREAVTEDEIAVKFTALGGDVIGKDQCKKLQSFIMSMETANDFSGLFELTTARA